MAIKKKVNPMPLLVGQAPSKGRNGLPPFTGRSGIFLAGLVGLPLLDFLGRVEAVNLLKSWPGRSHSSKGDAFPLDRARRAADLIDIDRRIVIAVGQGVGRCFDAGTEYFKANDVRGGIIYVMPHPSGIVTWWNDLDNKRRAATFLKNILGIAEE